MKNVKQPALCAECEKALILQAQDGPDGSLFAFCQHHGVVAGVQVLSGTIRHWRTEAPVTVEDMKYHLAAAREILQQQKKDGSEVGTPIWN